MIPSGFATHIQSRLALATPAYDSTNEDNVLRTLSDKNIALHSIKYGVENNINMDAHLAGMCRNSRTI